MLYICEICHTLYMKKSLYERHKNRKTPCVIQCKICKKYFTNRESLIYHTNNKVCLKFDVYYCPECDIAYHYKKHYDKHMARYHPKPPIKKYDPTLIDFFS